MDFSVVPPQSFLDNSGKHIKTAFQARVFEIKYQQATFQHEEIFVQFSTSLHAKARFLALFNDCKYGGI
jgi:hypothetical protein